MWLSYPRISKLLLQYGHIIRRDLDFCVLGLVIKYTQALLAFIFFGQVSIDTQGFLYYIKGTRGVIVGHLISGPFFKNERPPPYL